MAMAVIRGVMVEKEREGGEEREMKVQRSELQATTKVPCMQSGDGEDSYANSSRPQNFVFDVYAKPRLSEALDHLYSSLLSLGHLGIHRSSAGWPAAIAIADFGCSNGRNTLDTAAFVVQGIQERLGGNVQRPMEMQYFFSDLPANDFNSLFQCLPGFLHRLQQSAHAPHFTIFTGAVAGSFHDALFPSKSLHFATSFYSLHWLSQVPKEVLDKQSEAWNGGHIWLHRERPQVMEAYSRQHTKDMRRFFQSRVQELAKGGMIFLLYPCQMKLHPSKSFYDHMWSSLLESVWTDMVCEGLISKEERDTFNMPFYISYENELHEVLEEFVSELELVKMEVISDCLAMVKEEEEKLLKEPKALGKFWANFAASLVRPMIQTHLDEARAVELFKRFENLATLESNHYPLRKNDTIMAIIRRL